MTSRSAFYGHCLGSNRTTSLSVGTLHLKELGVSWVIDSAAALTEAPVILAFLAVGASSSSSSSRASDLRFAEGLLDLPGAVGVVRVRGRHGSPDE